MSRDSTEDHPDHAGMRFEGLRDRLRLVQGAVLPSPPDLEEIRRSLDPHVAQIRGNPANPQAGVGALDKLIENRIKIAEDTWTGTTRQRHDATVGELMLLRAELSGFAEQRQRAAQFDQTELDRVLPQEAAARAQVLDAEIPTFDLPPNPDLPADTRASMLHAGQINEVEDAVGRSWTSVLYYLVLALAIGVDVAAFFQVFALAMRAVPEFVVWLGAVGFTAVALGLAHLLGSQMRRHVRRAGHRPWTSIAGWLLAGSWAAVGTVAFVVRIAAPPVSGGDGSEVTEEGIEQALTLGTSNTLPALFFLALFVATGAVTSFVAYRHNPGRAFRKLKKQEEALRKRLESSSDHRNKADALVKVCDYEVSRRREAWEQGQRQLAGYAEELKAWADLLSRQPRVGP